MTETRELICINCPLGCGLTVTLKDGDVVKVEDWSALLDTADTAAALGRNMVLFTLAANLLLIWRIFRKERR